MPLAPSFAEFERLSEPFYENGKYYMNVRNPKTGTERKVRWYTDAEYAKNYGKKLSTDDGFDGLKHARGFDNGPILVIRGNRADDEEWLRASITRYAVGIGWYIVSTDTLPEDAPKHFKYLLLGWQEAIIDERHMKKPNDLNALLAEKARKREWVNFND